MASVLRNFIGGEWTPSSGKETQDVRNPATGEVIARTPLSTKQDVDTAVQAAAKAFKTWRTTPAPERARVLFRYKMLLEEHFEELSAIVTREHGKTLSESRGSVRRGIENVEHACGIPTLMMGDSLEDISRGIDCETIRQPRGVYAAITPYNFPAMVPLWFWPYAIATGNTFVFKPSEQVPMVQERLMQLATQAGMPPGVLNMVHGAKDVVEAIAEHPGIAGVSFVGSSPVAKLVYEKGTRSGKRVQALGGAKNFIVVMPDADLNKSCEIAAESAFGCAGQRCLAGSTVIAVGDAYDKVKELLIAAAKNTVVGDGSKDGVTMGPVISARHKERVLGYIAKGVAEGAKVLVDGRNVRVPGGEQGFFVGPTLITDVTPEMTIAREEIFGPVLILRKAKDLADAISTIHASDFANATSIFTSSGKAAREFRYNVGVSMIGVNIGVAAPMAFFPFGGTKGSFFGDLKAHGKDSISFFTDTKVVISRWF